MILTVAIVRAAATMTRRMGGEMHAAAPVCIAAGPESSEKALRSINI